MNKKQIMSELKESVEDVLNNLTSVKGEAYSKTVLYAHLGMHTAQLIVQVLSSHAVPKDTQRLLVFQHANLMDMGLELISDAQGMSEATMQEIIDWSVKLNSKVSQAAENLSQES